MQLHDVTRGVPRIAWQGNLFIEMYGEIRCSCMREAWGFSGVIDCAITCSAMKIISLWSSYRHSDTMTSYTITYACVHDRKIQYTNTTSGLPAYHSNEQRISYRMNFEPLSKDVTSRSKRLGSRSTAIHEQFTF